MLIMSMSAVDDKAAVVAVEGAAGELRREFFSDELLDRLLDATSERGVELTGRGGFLSEFIKAV
ncbi:IS256 family transposase, partial [Mobiluncus mulieris]|nr:IS256 family transposase [Mobiluncus mulieris]